MVKEHVAGCDICAFNMNFYNIPNLYDDSYALLTIPLVSYVNRNSKQLRYPKRNEVSWRRYEPDARAALFCTTGDDIAQPPR